MRQGPQQQVASNVLAVMCLFLSHVTPPDPFCLSAQEIFVVMTDSFHKPGFKLHAHILHHLFSALDAGACCLPDGSSFFKCAAQHPVLWEGRRPFICWPQPWPQAPACCQVCLSEGEGWVDVVSSQQRLLACACAFDFMPRPLCRNHSQRLL